MIELKMMFTTPEAAMAFLEWGARSTRPPLTEADAKADLAGTPRPGNPTVKPVDTPKAADATAKPTAKTETAAQKTPPPESSALTYEVVGAAISKTVTDPSNKPAVKALLGEFDAKDGSGKATNGQKLKPEDYPAFMEKLAAIGEDLG